MRSLPNCLWKIDAMGMIYVFWGPEQPLWTICGESVYHHSLTWLRSLRADLKNDGFMPVYLDYHSHALMHPKAKAATFEAYERFDSNPHSTHTHGTLAHDAVEKSRYQVAQLIGARPSEIVFTSGATEANNLVFSGLRDLLASQSKKRVAIGAIEHPSVLKAAETLRLDNIEVVCLPVHTDGLIDLAAAAEIITPDTGIVSVAAANHEVGVVQPLAALSELVRTRGGLLHSDLAQAAGKIELDLRVLDLASISSHKLGGPGGIGALYVRRLVRPKMKPLLAGGGQEAGLRSGTLPTPLCVGFGVACQLAAEEMVETGSRVRRMRSSLLTKLLAISGSRLNGSATARLPVISTFLSTMWMARRWRITFNSQCRSQRDRHATQNRSSPRLYCWRWGFRDMSRSRQFASASDRSQRNVISRSHRRLSRPA